MYAVIKTGGQQFKVAEGTTLKVEKLEVEPGKKVTFKEVLMVADGEKVQIGAPTVAKASVEAKVISQGKGKKVHILKFRRRKHSMKQQGHRQLFTEVEITLIILPNLLSFIKGTNNWQSIWLHFKCNVNAFSNSLISALKIGPPAGPPVLFTKIWNCKSDVCKIFFNSLGFKKSATK